MAIEIVSFPIPMSSGFQVQTGETKPTKPEAPEDFDSRALPALNYLMFSPKALLLWSLWDPYHRAWNDLKLALKNPQELCW